MGYLPHSSGLEHWQHLASVTRRIAPDDIEVCTGRRHEQLQEQLNPKRIAEPARLDQRCEVCGFEVIGVSGIPAKQDLPPSWRIKGVYRSMQMLLAKKLKTPLPGNLERQSRGDPFRLRHLRCRLPALRVYENRHLTDMADLAPRQTSGLRDHGLCIGEDFPLLRCNPLATEQLRSS